MSSMDNNAFLQEINEHIERTSQMLREVDEKRNQLILLLTRMHSQRDMVFLASGDKSFLRHTVGFDPQKTS